ncbi:MAG: hypothetical protein ACFFE5_04000, partial [Candidatus Thorarchaeota archaeon]
NIMEYPIWKIVLLLIVSLPLLFLLAIILIALFFISIVSYFFFTSWFILYGCYLIGIGIEKKLLKFPRSRSFIRTIIFFGGIGGSLLLLYLFLIGPTLFDFSLISTEEVPLFLNLSYVVVGCVIIGLAVYAIILMFKKSFNAWLGIFFILVAVYTLFLVVKIYLGLDDAGTNTAQSIWTDIGLLIVDLAIILYVISTLLGKNAELLAQRFKHIGIDTAIIWLIFSKVSYEFLRYFPYNIFETMNFPFSQFLSDLNTDQINYYKNVAVLVFFIILLLVIGIYEIRKYSKQQKELNQEVKYEVKELLSSQPTIDEPITSTEEPPAIKTESEIKEEEEDKINQEKYMESNENKEKNLE